MEQPKKKNTVLMSKHSRNEIEVIAHRTETDRKAIEPRRHQRQLKTI